MLLYGKLQEKKSNCYQSHGLPQALELLLKLKKNFIKNLLIPRIHTFKQSINFIVIRLFLCSKLANKIITIIFSLLFHILGTANSKNIKNTWAGIKDLITLKPKGLYGPSKIVVGNSTIKDPKSIAATFNEFFSNIGRKLASDIPPVDIDPQLFLAPPQANSFLLFPVTTLEIEHEITNLNSSKASGPFSIPICLLKLLKTCLSFPLQIIFNFSFSSGCVPDQFKVANVIPIHKKDSVTCMSNYRPISLLSIFSKIMEKLVCKRLTSFIDKHQILFDNQFGFRERHSTMHAILLITDKIQKAIEKGLFSCGIFLDISKAFDTVDHSILIKKLSNYGIRGIANEWFSSYLSNRKQHVSIGSTKSEDLVITRGVPQGSVLGPLLFHLYINDFSNCSKLFDFHVFADDTNLFYSNSSLAELEICINNNLKLVSNWLKVNKLSLNIDKTNFIIFHPPQKATNYQVRLLISNVEIKQERYIKYLGLFIDSHLSWKFHILHITKKIKRCIGILSKIRYFVSQQILVQLYYTLIYPFLTYSLVTWGNTYQAFLRPFITIQKKAVRIITFSEYNSHSSPLFSMLELLKFNDLIYLDNALFMFDYHANTLPVAFNNFFKSLNKAHPYNTRLASRSSYYLPKVRTNFGKFNIRFNGVKIWNSIEENLKSKSRTQFKKLLKRSIISHY